MKSPLKSPLYCLGIALFFCLVQPALADKARTSATIKAPSPAQVTVTERDAHEKVVTTQTTDLAGAMSLASERVPGALSGNPADVKSLTITYN